MIHGIRQHPKLPDQLISGYVVSTGIRERFERRLHSLQHIAPAQDQASQQGHVAKRGVIGENSGNDYRLLQATTTSPASRSRSFGVNRFRNHTARDHHALLARLQRLGRWIEQRIGIDHERRITGGVAGHLPHGDYKCQQTRCTIVPNSNFVKPFGCMFQRGDDLCIQLGGKGECARH